MNIMGIQWVSLNTPGKLEKNIKTVAYCAYSRQVIKACILAQYLRVTSQYLSALAEPHVVMACQWHYQMQPTYSCRYSC